MIPFGDFWKIFVLRLLPARAEGFACLTGWMRIAKKLAMSTIYVLQDGQKTGPFTTEELEGKVEAGALSREDLFWIEGMEEWQPLASVMEIEAITGHGNWRSREASLASSESIALTSPAASAGARP